MDTLPPPRRYGESIRQLDKLRAIALRHLDAPLSHVVRLAWTHRLASLEQAICDAETRVGWLEFWRSGAPRP